MESSSNFGYGYSYSYSCNYGYSYINSCSIYSEVSQTLKTANDSYQIREKFCEWQVKNVK